MTEQSTDYKTRQQPIDAAETGLAPMPVATLKRRRRVLQFGWLGVFVLGLGFSAIPGPKGSSETISYVGEGRAQTAVHEFYYSRHLGRPFTAGRIDLNDDGSVKSVSMKGDGLLSNFGVALLIMIGVSIYIGRRRRDD